MTPQAFRAALSALGLTPTTFAAVSGANQKSARRWALSDDPIPRWVPVMLQLLALPGAMPTPAAPGRVRTGDGRFSAPIHPPAPPAPRGPRPGASAGVGT